MTRCIQAMLALGLLSLAGCGGQRRPQCQLMYDDCTNACADTCSNPRAQEPGTEPDRVNTYSARCKACVDQCVAHANRCDARESDVIDPDGPVGDTGDGE